MQTLLAFVSFSFGFLDIQLPQIVGWLIAWLAVGSFNFQVKRS